MRGIVYIHLAVIAVAAAGFGFCRAAGWATHPAMMMLAAAITAIAATLGLVPAMRARRRAVVDVSQAALGGTVIHMGVVFLLSAVAWVVGRVSVPSPFLFWLLSFYWTTLAALVAALVPIIRRSAPMAE